MKKNDKKQAYEELRSTLRNFINSEDKVNSYPIRFHRLYLDGSYGSLNPHMSGERLYKMHLGMFSKKNKEETLKSHAIATFKNFVSIEFFNKEYLIRIGEIESILSETLGECKDEFVDLLVENIKDLVAQ